MQCFRNSITDCNLLVPSSSFSNNFFAIRTYACKCLWVVCEITSIWSDLIYQQLVHTSHNITAHFTAPLTSHRYLAKESNLELSHRKSDRIYGFSLFFVKCGIVFSLLHTVGCHIIRPPNSQFRIMPVHALLLLRFSQHFRKSSLSHTVNHVTKISRHR